jgi:hypothetical protein
MPIPRSSADKGAVAGESQRVAEHGPQNGNQERRRQALRHGGEHVLLAHHAGIEQREPRDGHHQHQPGGGDHPGGVGAVDLGRLLCGLRKRRRCSEGRRDRTRGHGKAV